MQANSIARYNLGTSQWEPLVDANTFKNGVNGTVNTILLQGSNVYVGGSFTKAGGKTCYNLAYWDTNTNKWFEIGSSSVKNGTNGPVYTIIYNSPYFYIGGDFTGTDFDGLNVVPPNKFYRIALSNGTTSWLYLGTSGTQNGANGVVHTLYYDIPTSRIYVGGDFTSVDNTAFPANRIAYFDEIGLFWNYLGSSSGQNGTNASVNSVTVDNANNICVGGNFTLVDFNGITGTKANYIALYNGGTWSYLSQVLLDPLKNGTNGQVRTLYYDSSLDYLYVGGTFTGTDFNGLTTVGDPYYNTVRWKGGGWSQVGSNNLQNGANGTVYSISYSNVSGQTYLGGKFLLVDFDGVNGLRNVNNVSFWDGGTKWNNLEYIHHPGIDGTVRALTVIGDDIYVGGDFTKLNFGSGPSNTLNYIARWNVISQVWHPLTYVDPFSAGHIGLNGIVNALATNGTVLYVGGDFTAIDAASVPSDILNYIGIWNPVNETWMQIITSVDYGLDKFVKGLSCRSPYTSLYVSGDFNQTQGGAISIAHIARVDLTELTAGFKQILDSVDNYGVNNTTANTILDFYPYVYFGGDFANSNTTFIPMPYLGYYLYTYISDNVQVDAPPGPELFLDTQTGVISTTFNLTNRFKSMTIVSCQELTDKYWLIMYRS